MIICKLGASYGLWIGSTVAEIENFGDILLDSPSPFMVDGQFQWREANWQTHILLIYIWVRMEHTFQWGGTKWGTDTNQIPPKSNM